MSRNVSPNALHIWRLALILIVTTAPSVARADLPTPPGPESDAWTVARHDARNTGFNPHEVAPPLRLAWKTRLGPGEWRQLLSAGGMVFAGGSRWVNGAWKYQTKLVNGERRVVWTMDDALPLYFDGAMLVVRTNAGSDGAIRCYNWRSHGLLWSREIGPMSLDPDQGSANVSDRRLYYAYRSADGRAVILAVELKDGSETARKELDGGWWRGPPAIDGEHVYWGISHWMRVLDANTLEPLIAFYNGGNSYPVVGDNRLLVKGWLHYITAWDVAARRAAWSMGGPRDVAHSLVKVRGKGELLVETSSALNVATGERVWNQPIEATCSAGAGRFVYLAGKRSATPSSGAPKRARGGFYCIDASTGRLYWAIERWGLVGTSVIVSGGRLYGIGSDSSLYCFQPSHRRVRRHEGKQ